MKYKFIEEEIDIRIESIKQEVDEAGDRLKGEFKNIIKSLNFEIKLIK